MFAALKDRLTGGANRVSGKTDYLEGTVAICALTAAADGTIEDAEFDSIVNSVKANKTLGGAFAEHQIVSIVDSYLNKAKTRPGRLELRRELGEIKDQASKEMALMTALEVADNGGISDAEMQVLKDCAQILGLKLADYMV